MTAFQLTLLTGLAIMLVSVLVFVWSTYRWLKNITLARVYLALEETDEVNRLIEKFINKANSQAKLMNSLHPFVSQIKYLFIPTLVIFAVSFLF